MGMTPDQLDHLDAIARELRQRRDDRLYVLSTGERLYVCMAANRMDLCPRGYGVADGIARLGWEDVRELVRRWQYA